MWFNLLLCVMQMEIDFSLPSFHKTLNESIKVLKGH